MPVFLWQALCVCLTGIILEFLLFFPCAIESSELGQGVNEDLYIEPPVVSVFSGENVTFKCSSPRNVSFMWHLSDNIHPFKVTKGRGVDPKKYNNHSYFWSTIELLRVKRTDLKKIACSAEGKQQRVSASLTVNGIRIGGTCQSADDCITNRAQCLSGICSCPLHRVLLRLNPGEQLEDVCSEIIYKLYDSCEYTEQCKNLVDPLSICGTNSICTCPAWATDSSGKCVSKNEMSYNRNQEMYRVGLIAVTCVIIVIVAVSLWVTLRRSCHEEISITPRISVTSSRNSDNSRLSSSSVFEISTDKPPSYDELVESGDSVSSSPPDIKDALQNCMTAKKLVRQVSAPAGQLISKETSANLYLNNKSGNVNPVFNSNE